MQGVAQIVWLHWYLFNRMGNPRTFLFVCFLYSLFLVSSHPNLHGAAGRLLLIHICTHFYPKHSSRVQGWHDKLTPYEAAASAWLDLFPSLMAAFS